MDWSITDANSGQEVGGGSVFTPEDMGTGDVPGITGLEDAVEWLENLRLPVASLELVIADERIRPLLLQAASGDWSSAGWHGDRGISDLDRLGYRWTVADPES